MGVKWIGRLIFPSFLCFYMNFYNQGQPSYGMPFPRMPTTPMDARAMSPSYAAFMMHQAAQISPTYDMYRNFGFGPGSPLQVFF